MLERVMGIEPTYEAWEAAVLPLNYTRVCADSSRERGSAVLRDPLDQRVERRRRAGGVGVVDHRGDGVDAAAARLHVAGERASVEQGAGLQVGVAGGLAVLHAVRERAVDAGDRQRIDERI